MRSSPSAMAWETVARRFSQSYGRSLDLRRGTSHLRCALALSLCSCSHRTRGPAFRHTHPRRRAAAQKNRVRSTKGVLIEQRSTPDTVSHSGVAPLVSASRDGGNGQGRGDTKYSASEGFADEKASQSESMYRLSHG